MKGRTLILIFLFLLLALCIPVSADNSSFYFNQSSTSQNDETLSYTVNSGSDVIASIHVNDMDAFQGVRHIILTAPHAYWAGPSSNSEWAAVEYKIGSVVVATGTFGFNKGASNYYVGAFFDEENQIFDQYSGAQGIEIIGSYPAIRWSDAGTVYDTSLGTDIDMGYLALGSGGNAHAICGRTGVSTTQTTISYDFSNKILYDTVDGNFNLWIEKQGQNSKYDISNVHETFFYEASVNTNDQYILNTDIQNSTWAVEAENGYGDVFSKTISFMVASSGTIELNQTNYVDPENIQVEWDILNFNSDNYNYEIQIVTSVSGDPSQDSWAADGNWNTSPFISSASGAAVFDFYSDGYDLPIWIQGELWAQDKTTGTWTRLDSTSVERYHEKSDFGVGSIWTEKSTYNLSEMFYIFVETDYSIIDIELISDTYHDRQTLEVFEGGWQRLGYAFFSPHNFTAYLYEDGVITNQTSFSVWTTSPMLNIFLDSEALKSQFSFEFYTDNSSDTITGYKPDGSIFYGPITDLEIGDRNIITGISSSSPPGIYTISLFHDGTTYYNDTIELYSTSEYVYFEASKYETGDRIKIYSYVTDSRQQVRLTDSIGTAVITWTDSAGYIIPNSQTVLYFSLTDNNEYEMNVNTSIDAGTFRTGNWKVEIIGIDGKPLTDESTYDYTTVSKRIESPADTSNEMISIFFSPEGAFLLFTVCLTMMGLGIAKHPAGGGAGAAVGTGFGVYFNVLPPWLLFLTVIALVVLAGVSVAVYFKGK